MTYFLFLAIFLGVPIVLLLGVTWWDRQNGRLQLAHFGNQSPWLILVIHILVALIYTTPWDNYLVATRVWWYDPQLVTGMTIGWVPIEEYTFFLVQPIFTGLWLLFWMRRIPMRQPDTETGWRNDRFRYVTTTALSVIWIVMMGVFVVNWRPGTYLALQLSWAIPPILLQCAFGADILWYHRRLIGLALIPPTLFLAAADALAIQAGTWVIDPTQSLYWLLGGVLPVEEFLFFLITNTLIVFGMTLALSVESRQRLVWLQTKLVMRKDRQMT